MAIIETKADELMSLVSERKKISSTDAAKDLGAEEPYIRKLALILHKRNMVDIDATPFLLWIIAKE